GDEGRSAPPVRARRIRVPAQSSHAPGKLLSHVSALQRRRCCFRHPLRGCERGGDFRRQGTEAVRKGEGEEEMTGHPPAGGVARRYRSSHPRVACHAWVACRG